MKKCAFLTLDQRGDYVIDDEHAIAPLEQLGWVVSTLSWRQTDIPWSDFDAVVIRSTWDYWNDVPAFLDTLSAIDRQARLENPLEMVQWNLVKTYLADLESSGIGIVPTLWPAVVSVESFPEFFGRLGCSELVIKPIVGANGDDAYRVSADDPVERLTRISGRFGNRKALVQPFMPRILTEGEYSLFFFNGEFSHAILKTPTGTEFRSQEERGGEITSVVPDERLLYRGLQALAVLSTVPLYARADFVRNEKNDFVVMELELIEPSMYLRTHPDAPARFAQAIDRRFG